MSRPGSESAAGSAPVAPSDAPGLSTPAAPPTHRGTAPRHQRPPMWPTVIGTISIVLGAAAVVMSAFGALTLFLMEKTAPGVAGVTPRIVMLTAINAGLGALVALLLLAAGIQTCRRRANGRPLHMSWAVLKIIYAIISALLGHYAQQEQLATLASSPPAGAPNPAIASGMMGTMLWVQLFFTTLWYSAYPIFILIWFNTRNTKHDCATWK